MIAEMDELDNIINPNEAILVIDGTIAQCRATVKCPITATCHSAGDGYACERCAMSKCLITNACNTVGDGYACQ